jgi:antitoxin (DNA-binding transcriptional repressor) of toxin-antitoxin stability system
VPVIGVRQLTRETAAVLKQLESDREPVVITRQGRPVATLAAVNPDEVRDLVLGLAPELAETDSTVDVEPGDNRIRTLDEVAEELVTEAKHTDEGRQALSAYEEELAGRKKSLVFGLDRLFSEGPMRLGDLSGGMIASWGESAERLVGGAIDAALESARHLGNRVEDAGSGRRKRAKGAETPSEQAESGGQGARRQGRRAKTKRKSEAVH